LLRRFIIAGILGYFALFMVLLLLMGFRWNKYRKTPDQPINFSHQIHAGKLNLDCLFCHESADDSYFAGVPSVQKCMECHINVKTDSPEVQKIHKYWNDKKPIPWNRVHRIRMRNYVYFTHERHLKAENVTVNNPGHPEGEPGIECEACHGQVKAMKKMRAFSSLKMGWCVSCHRANDAPTDCLTCHR
jgi:hypothetical protein